jgi:hypothetical protein
MKLQKSVLISGAAALALASAPSWAFVESTWSAWATASDNIATADPTVLKPFNGLTVSDKTIALVDFDDEVVIQGTPEDATGLTSNRAFPGNATGLPGGTGPTVQFQDLGNGRHQVTFAAPGAFPFNSMVPALEAGDILAVQYVINIDTSLYPAEGDELVFGSVDLGLNVNASGDLTVFKRVQGLTPNAVTNGSVQWSANTDFDLGAVFDETIFTETQVDETVFCGVCTAFLVTDYVVIGADAPLGTSLSSISNTFEQTNVPVPAPLALLGLGMVGLFASRRMLNKKVG